MRKRILCLCLASTFLMSGCFEEWAYNRPDFKAAREASSREAQEDEVTSAIEDRLPSGSKIFSVMIHNSTVSVMFYYNGGKGFPDECAAVVSALESLPEYKDYDYDISKINGSKKPLAIWTKDGLFSDFRESGSGKQNVSLDQLADLATSLYDGESTYTGSLTLKNGYILDYSANDGVAVIKAKIEPSLTNKMTIDQNYYNVCDLIQNQGVEPNELQYWAVADMTDGGEEKVISFTLDSATIAAVKAGTIVENRLGDYVSDLWILPSLQ